VVVAPALLNHSSQPIKHYDFSAHHQSSGT